MHLQLLACLSEVEVMKAPAVPTARSVRTKLVAEQTAAAELAAAREEDVLQVILTL